MVYPVCMDTLDTHWSKRSLEGYFLQSLPLQCVSLDQCKLLSLGKSKERKGEEATAGVYRIQCTPSLPGPPAAFFPLFCSPLCLFCPPYPLPPLVLSYLLQLVPSGLVMHSKRLWPSHQCSGSTLLSKLQEFALWLLSSTWHWWTTSSTSRMAQ